MPNQLPEQYRDHYLKGDYAGYKECHVEPDWLLIYDYETSTTGSSNCSSSEQGRTRNYLNKWTPIDKTRGQWIWTINSRVSHVSLLIELGFTAIAIAELRRIESAEDVSENLLAPIRTVAEIINGFGSESKC